MDDADIREKAGSKDFLKSRVLIASCILQPERV